MGEISIIQAIAQNGPTIVRPSAAQNRGTEKITTSIHASLTPPLSENSYHVLCTPLYDTTHAYENGEEGSVSGKRQHAAHASDR